MQLDAPLSGPTRWRKVQIHFFSLKFFWFLRLLLLIIFPNLVLTCMQECLMLIPVEALIEYKGDFANSAISIFAFLQRKIDLVSLKVSKLFKKATLPTLPPAWVLLMTLQLTLSSHCLMRRLSARALAHRSFHIPCHNSEKWNVQWPIARQKAH